MTDTPDILFCNCSHKRIVPAGVKRAVLAALAAAGVGYIATDDLCGLAARRDPRLRRLVEADGLKVVACFDRAVRWLFHWAGAPLDAARAEVLNMRAEPAADIIQRLLGARAAPPPDPAAAPEIAAEGDWVPWFPVIDYDRCTHCGQCHSFCPFDVYEITPEGKVGVARPANCKDNCPACARICPEVAIMFPKFEGPPVNGAPVADEQLERRRAAAMRKHLAGGDLRQVLARRRQALRERMAAEPPRQGGEGS